MDAVETNGWIPILSDPLTDEQKTLLADSTCIHYPYKGEVLFHVGDQPQWLHYLLEGSVTVYAQDANGQTRTANMLSPGTIFGYRDAFCNANYTHTAIANEDTIVAKISLSTIFHLIWENSAFAMVFIKDLSDLLGLSLRHTIIVTKKNIRGRLAECILRMKAKYGIEEDGTLPIYLSRENLAGMSNMTTSNAIRTLSAFIDEGLVSLAGRRIKILNEKGLQRVSAIG
ncbi:MAG: Crp/Fnr family transcriptional regulator [Prevotella sp.]|nr:Crp/Fnr family transcriptional regulator [Prevotella sp.]